MIALVPKWAHHYEEFWSAIKARNLWFIKIRYAFVAALLVFVVGGEVVLKLNLSSRQLVVILSITGIIFLFNILIHYYRRRINCIPGKFNPLHLSLVQIIFDLITLLVLIYYTGGIDSPLYIFAIFHTIIGSLILPGYIVYTILSFYLIAYIAMSFLQYYNILHVHFLKGIVLTTPDHNISFILLFIIIYSVMILLSVYIANKISYQLYNREQQLKTSLEQIEKLEGQKQKYIIGVVHEIKTPISAIQSFANLLLDEYVGPLPDKVREKIERIKIRSSDALTLVNNVLYISRLKLLNLTSFEKIDIISIINNLLEKRSNDVKSKEMNVSVSDKRKYNYDLYADNLLMELAISNLICNSFKYTNVGGRITIELYDNERYLSIVISDSGMGIPDNELQNVCHEFYRATNVKKSDMEGSGLGLALVKEVIERHNGKIKIISPSKIGTVEYPGTTVELNIPYSTKPIKE